MELVDARDGPGATKRKRSAYAVRRMRWTRAEKRNAFRGSVSRRAAAVQAFLAAGRRRMLGSPVQGELSPLGD